MQSIKWYLERLRSMSPTEVLWRVRSAVRDQVDKPRFALGLYPSPSIPQDPSELVDVGPKFRLHDWEMHPYGAPRLGTDEAAWHADLVQRADKLLNHRISFFSLEDCHIGNPIDWNRDHEAGKAAPQDFSGSIDYRDYRVTGDAKMVWELNRHHHLVVLARAYHVTGELRYAEAVVAQMRSWCQSCPFGRGMNWRSPLELAIRLINWVWALDLIWGSGLLTPSVQREFLPVMYLHMWEITRKYSQGSSANNHRIGEAAGVFVASLYFPVLDPQGDWNKESRAILLEEIRLQTYLDGANREQAIGYHLFVLQFFLLSGLIAQRANADFPEEYRATVNSMLGFIGKLSEGGARIPPYGDGDDGYVLDLGNGPESARGLLAIGAVWSRRSDFKNWAGQFQQAAYWLLGPDARAQFDAIPSPSKTVPLQSHAFSDSGHYLLQCGHTGSADRISVLFDCGELGFQSIAAHGHADALSVTVRAFGEDILIDPGTYDYFRYPQWRTYFRSTRAHNTIMIDSRDQSEMLGSFLWGHRAQARCLTWKPHEYGGQVVGEHDGYANLDDPVIHKRTVDLDGEVRTLTIRDEIVARVQHRIQLFFHFAAHCYVATDGSNRLVISSPGGTVVFVIDTRLTLEFFSGNEEPIAGWESYRYHHKQMATTVVASADCHGAAQYTCAMVIGEAS